MTVETATYLGQLDPNLPTGADFQSEGDNHIRLIKAALQATFPSANGPFRAAAGAVTQVADFTITNSQSGTVFPVGASLGNRIVTLPVMDADHDGFNVVVFKSDGSTNTVTVDGAGSDALNGALTQILAKQYQGVRLTWLNSYGAWFVEQLQLPALLLTGGTLSGKLYGIGSVTGNNGINVATTNLGEIEVRGNGTGAAMLALVRPGGTGMYLGLHTDNLLKHGGWTAGANAYKIFSEGQPPAMADVTGLVAALAAKSAVGHTHVVADITDLVGLYTPVPTNTGATDTSYPVGTLLLAFAGGVGTKKTNATISVYAGTDGGITGSPVNTSAEGTILTGTWRIRGFAGLEGVLVQRTA